MSRPERPRHIAVFAHRGASGYRPEHTLEAYRLAIELGADAIEPDLVITRDGVLVARHENEISGTTDVSTRPEFAERRTVRVVDGVKREGWFTEDFTLEELKTLRATERLPRLRPTNTLYDGRWEIPTFDEILDLVVEESALRKRTIGVTPDTKHPEYFAARRLPLEAPLLESLDRVGWDANDSPAIIQSFGGNLPELAAHTDVPLLQLFHRKRPPAPEQLRDVAEYASWIGVDKSAPLELIDQAHVVGLKAAVYTFRDENKFLPEALRLGESKRAFGAARTELFTYFAAGVDAVFSDFTDTAVNARDLWASLDKPKLDKQSLARPEVVE